LHLTLSALLGYVNTFVPEDLFTAFFVNYYHNPFDSIGNQSDKDVAVKVKVSVITISYGAQRTLTFHPIDTKNMGLKVLHVGADT